METETPVIFEWSVHPPRLGGYRRIVFILTLVLVPYGLLKAFEHPLWAFFATVFLLGSTTGYWLPTRYTLDESGIKLERWFWRRRLEYRNLKRVDKDPNGLFVSPFATRSWLDGHRGMLLMMPPEPEKALEFLRQRIGRAA